MRYKLWTAALLLTPGLLAQTAQTALFRAVLLSSNEATAPAGNDSGAATVAVHVVRDSAGKILSGSVDLSLTYQFPNDSTIQGLVIANSPAGQTGAVAFATDVTAAAPINAAAGTGHVYRQVQIAAGDASGIASLTGLIASPGQYSVNVLTADSPAGAMSGTLQPANLAVLMAMVVAHNATGAATVNIIYTGSVGGITSGEVTMQLAYQFAAQVTFSALRVYAGQGQGGQLAIPAELQPGTKSAVSGTGVLNAPATEIDMSNTRMVQWVQSMIVSPGSFTVVVDTLENLTAPLTGPLRGTDAMTFQLPNLAGSATASAVNLHTLRWPSGGVLAATVIFDVNYRLAAGSQITGLDIDGSVPASAVTADPSGSGNIFSETTVYHGPGLSALDNTVRDPEAHHINLQSSASAPATAALAPTNTAPPVVAAVIPIVEDKTLSTFAPGELVEIYGTNLAKVTTDLSGWPGGSLPQSLNGVAVAVGSQFGRILYVSPNQVDAELAFETPLGAQLLSLNNGNAPSAPISINVAGVAPAIYKFAFKNADFSLISSSNPAKAGDVLVFYTTGFGQTTPVLATGAAVPEGPPFFNTATIVVTIGGKSANVIYSIAAPPYVAGLYQMAVTVPAGLGPGSVQVTASAGGITSNPVVIPVQ